LFPTRWSAAARRVARWMLESELEQLIGGQKPMLMKIETDELISFGDR
jgi:hypothetical protein